jgi:hypothetical protein
MRASLDSRENFVHFPTNRFFNNLRSPLPTSYAAYVRRVETQIVGDSGIKTSEKGGRPWGRNNKRFFHWRNLRLLLVTVNQMWHEQCHKEL